MGNLKKEEAINCQRDRVNNIKRILRRHKNDPIQSLIWKGRLEEAEVALVGFLSIK